MDLFFVILDVINFDAPIKNRFFYSQGKPYLIKFYRFCRNDFRLELHLMAKLMKGGDDAFYLVGCLKNGRLTNRVMITKES